VAGAHPLWISDSLLFAKVPYFRHLTEKFPRLDNLFFWYPNTAAASFVVVGGVFGIFSLMV
jgi:hypothetical protein